MNSQSDIIIEIHVRSPYLCTYPTLPLLTKKPIITYCNHRSQVSSLYLGCGEGGIRTLDRIAPITVFETVRFNHSRTSPWFGLQKYEFLSTILPGSPRSANSSHSVRDQSILLPLLSSLRNRVHADACMR